MGDLRGKWLPSGAGLAGFLAATLALFIGLPIIAILFSGGGCEAMPRPCKSNDTAFYIALTLLALLLIGIWWGVKKLVNFFVHGS